MGLVTRKSVLGLYSNHPTQLQELAIILKLHIGHRLETACLRGFANNRGANQPARPRILIGAFVIRLLESIVPKLATSIISLF